MQIIQRYNSHSFLRRTSEILQDVSRVFIRKKTLGTFQKKVFEL
jgi:hypothetical protein